MKRDDFSYLGGMDIQTIENLYVEYQKDPESVPIFSNLKGYTPEFLGEKQCSLKNIGNYNKKPLLRS